VLLNWEYWRPLTNGRWGIRDESCPGEVVREYHASWSTPLFAPSEAEWPVSVSRYSSVDNSLQVRGRLNGDGGSAKVGVGLRPSAFGGFDEFVRFGCEGATNATVGVDDLTGTGDSLGVAELTSCDPSKGARVFDATGTRLTSLEDVRRVAERKKAVRGHPLERKGWDDELTSAADVWFVPAGLHWVWPTVAAGHETLTTIGDDPLLLVRVATLSARPAVFRVQGFLSKSEAEATVRRNEPRVRPSEVGLVGRAGDKTRTSSNAWDTSSPEARMLIGRAFDLLKLDANRKLEDGLQVLHYEPTQWYKPHVDYFTAKNGGGRGVDDDAFANAVPNERNGTNRFATVFLYLSDTSGGGETVFPLSTTHESYRGGRLTAAGTVRTPGFIRNDDAAWVCNHSSEALRVAPAVAEAALFYSQRGDAALDPYSLHGSCPVADGHEKWAANLWVWNRPRDAIDKAKAKASGSASSEQFSVTFHSEYNEPLHLHWDDGHALHKMGDLEPRGALNVNTYAGHSFVATKPADDARLHTFNMRRAQTEIVLRPPRPEPRVRKAPPKRDPNFAAPPKIFDPIVKSASSSSSN